jgi:predicted nucleic acid-binding protein
VLHLREAGALDILAKTGEALIPPTVNTELAARILDWPSTRPRWLQIGRLTAEDFRQARLSQAIGELGAGEAEAIALARSARADWLLTDDAGARIVASLFGLEVHGSLGVVLWGGASGHLPRAEAFAALEGLARSSLWVSPRIVDEAKQALNRLVP